MRCLPSVFYELSAPKTEKQIYNGHLKLGGKSVSGDSIEFNSFYMLENGVPQNSSNGKVSL